MMLRYLLRESPVFASKIAGSTMLCISQGWWNQRKSLTGAGAGAAAVIARARLMHAIDQNFDRFRRRELGNAVAEIEYVAAAVAEGSEDFFRFALHHFRRCKQHSRVKVALQRNTIADARTRLSYIHAPVESDCVAADGGDVLQPVAAALVNTTAGMRAPACSRLRPAMMRCK